MPVSNPFRPGAGHMPPYLAGRVHERNEFTRLLSQNPVLENLILTGLRGVGKTVLLETLKPVAISAKWLWVGTDLSESSSLSEERLALRLLTDLSIVTSQIAVPVESKQIGFSPSRKGEMTLNYETLADLYVSAPGLVSDKLKSVLLFVGKLVQEDYRGVIFAYDEAQVLADHAQNSEFPMSVLLDVFQSVQKQGLPFMLVLTGLPTLFPKLVEARTYAERMFRVVQLEKLSESESREAITKPIENEPNCPFSLEDRSIEVISDVSGGYPYFIQFVCREVFDVFIQKTEQGQTPVVPIKEIVRKLDTDFFAGRWSRVTDRQRELLTVIADLHSCEEFSVQEVVVRSRLLLEKPFGASQVNQMLSALGSDGLICKNRHGRYSFAVPLMENFIKRQANGP